MPGWETPALVDEHCVHCSVHQLDVADRLAVEAFAAEVVQTHGAVHAIFNNAGVTVVDSVENQSYEDFNWLMNINFWGVVYSTRVFLPYLKKVDEAHIINISSVFGLLSMPMQSAYNSSKFAVRGFTESLKMEMAGSHIQDYRRAGRSRHPQRRAQEQTPDPGGYRCQNHEPDYPTVSR